VISAVGIDSGRITGKPEVIHPDEKKSKFGQRLIALVACSQSIFALARASGATQEAHFWFLCRLLPPREIDKSF
jgi:hypothetical protein